MSVVLTESEEALMPMSILNGSINTMDAPNRTRTLGFGFDIYCSRSESVNMDEVVLSTKLCSGKGMKWY